MYSRYNRHLENCIFHYQTLCTFYLYFYLRVFCLTRTLVINDGQHLDFRLAPFQYTLSLLTTSCNSLVKISVVLEAVRRFASVVFGYLFRFSGLALFFRLFSYSAFADFVLGGQVGNRNVAR